MYHQWRNFPHDEAEPLLNIDCEPLTRRKGFFAALLNALHESRRRQAQRVIGQYRNLIAKERVIKAPDRNCEYVAEDISEMAITNDSRARRPSTSIKAWIIAVAVAFGILHIVGAIMLFGAPSTRPIETEPTSIHGD